MKGAFWISFRLMAFASIISSALCATYSRSENIVGTGFYNSFNFEAITDPNHGRVNYVNKTTAMSQNLTFASANTFILRGDWRTLINDSSTTGRNSVMIRSNNAYTTHVAVFDVLHMPQGCGTWPAIWETNGATWPNGGEVDIMEGVNDQGNDQVTLHTVAGCTMPASRTQTGFVPPSYWSSDTNPVTRSISGQLNCDTSVNGCGVNVGQASSFGPTFNADGGGWYAMERTNTFINVWFWSRKATNVPADVSTGGTTVNTSNWGIPVANFPNTTCNFPQFFDAHNIIINLNFCGDFAGQASVYASSGCPSTCTSYVDNNPAAFDNAYFWFNSINIYQ
ncbi:Glycoside hydrolase family 16 protein [Mycena sanguinolenta]|uniref:Glycoside hydrolase family 16 protein n=1 Tax=Mycena sanguinolenta TaxID=230812 RepID=A0A8H7DBS4_9AGAR|nr:Glycoside hydrolase family 16 protein [Mycena sanguinolenta]